MPTTETAPKPALRDRPLGKALAVLAVLVFAFLVARSCGSSHGEISKDEAIEIAQDQVSYEPDGIRVRNVPQGVPQQRIWAVALFIGDPDRPEKLTNVRVDSETGEVLEIDGPRS